jgi:squalene-associated FAD-dependent desaturase
MSKCLIAGGGLAGLSAAVMLLKNGVDVHLIEASPKLGGRTYSFHSDKINEPVDNGQHIMMGCYNETLKFLDIIGGGENVEIQDNLSLKFVKPGGDVFELATQSDLYPINLTRAIASYKALTVRERFRVLDLFLDLYCIEEEDIENLTVAQWLEDEGQDKNSRDALWDILAIGTLNSRCEDASAALFARVLNRVFFTGNEASKVVFPRMDLSRMYVNPAVDFIENNGGKISTGERILSIDHNSGTVTNVITSKNEYRNFDYFISAVPHYALLKILDLDISDELKNIDFHYSPIVSVHLLLESNPFENKLYGLINSSIHWIFNHDKYISLVTSAAEDLAEMDDQSIINEVFLQLGNYFPVFSPDFVLNWTIIREKRATFVPTPKIEAKRKLISSPFRNLYLAGDWTNTSLPATIEGAVQSGFSAAREILKL